MALGKGMQEDSFAVRLQGLLRSEVQVKPRSRAKRGSVQECEPI